MSSMKEHSVALLVHSSAILAAPTLNLTNIYPARSRLIIVWKCSEAVITELHLGRSLMIVKWWWASWSAISDQIRTSHPATQNNSISTWLGNNTETGTYPTLLISGKPQRHRLRRWVMAAGLRRMLLRGRGRLIRRRRAMAPWWEVCRMQSSVPI